MAYTITDPAMGIQPIAQVSSTQVHTLGKIVKADDPTYGSGEFIYLQGVASTVQGNVVNWGGTTTVAGVVTPSYQSALCPSTANLACPVAVAMGPCLAGQFGWYQITGTAIVLTNGTFAAAGPMYLGAAGNVTSTAAAGKQIQGAAGLTAVGTPAANMILATLMRPDCQGQIT